MPLDIFTVYKLLMLLVIAVTLKSWAWKFNSAWVAYMYVL